MHGLKQLYFRTSYIVGRSFLGDKFPNKNWQTQFSHEKGLFDYPNEINESNGYRFTWLFGTLYRASTKNNYFSLIYTTSLFITLFITVFMVFISVLCHIELLGEWICRIGRDTMFVSPNPVWSLGHVIGRTCIASNIAYEFDTHISRYLAIWAFQYYSWWWD